MDKMIERFLTLLERCAVALEKIAGAQGVETAAKLVTEKKAAATKPPAEAPVVAAPVATAKPVEEAKGPTKDDITEAVRAAVAKSGREAVAEVIANYGVARATLAPVEQWPALIAELTKLG